MKTLKTVYLLLLVAVMIIPTQVNAQSRKRGTSQRKTTASTKKSSGQSVKPLVIKRLSDYPTISKDITFTATKTPDEYPRYVNITVTKRGHKSQTFNIEGFECDPDLFPLVHYVDANFDGYTDLYLGTGEDRTYNNILLWDNNKGRFIKVFPKSGNYMPVPLFCAETKSIFTTGSVSAFSWFISEFKPKGNTLIQSETLEIEYDKNNKEHYLLRQGDGDGHVVATYSQSRALPQHWQRVLQSVKKRKKKQLI